MYSGKPTTEKITSSLVPPETVNYRPGDGEQLCGNCESFVPGADGEPGACVKVSGDIDPTMTCDLWSGQTGEQAFTNPSVPGNY